MIDRSLRDRYSRQVMFPGIGEAGQAKLLKSFAVIIGCGALGCNIAGLLARAGVGRIRIVDRDFVEYHNLQRQTLFDEDDVKARMPKAVAAWKHLAKVNSTIEIEGIIADANFTNIEEFCRGADVILDGLDNMETRFLINDVSLKRRIPWVYGAAVSAHGMTMTVIPGKTACLRCFYPVMPSRGSLPTCETAGIVGTVPAIIGSLQATEAIKILVGAEEINREVTIIDVWTGNFERIKVKPREDCPACGGRYEFLEARFAMKTTLLCGQTRAVQVINTEVTSVELDKMAARLQGASSIYRDEYLLRFDAGGYEITVFPDGRAIIKNTTDESQAVDLYRKYVG